VEMVDKTIENGFVSQTLEMALISEQDIWGKRTGPKSKKPARVEQRLLVEDLKLGDYVVHENYGIGIYHGVTQVETEGVTREYILLQYAGTDKLYLPVDKLDLLHRYTTSEEKQPRLSKLGGTEWDRTKKKVAESIQEMAEELLNLYAIRESISGYTFSKDTPWQQEFEDSFPYQETPDQLKAILDVKRDMEKSRPMDRLVCGDVGYGKTEVAMRAAFKAVMDSKQVAILVPTTVLAEQHYETFSARFQDYPTTVEVISRFKSTSRQKEILKDLQKGAIDILIGTHRLLSKDLQFKDLGLLIIDEEHRFGVAQKEKIKAFKNNVDVLSLSATPIPRSLHMSLTGLRDLTVIETPPPERYPVTTYVLEYNEEIIYEAVMSEIERNGQVFFVHNRIQDIYKVQEKLAQLLPGVSIGIGHGRMKEDELARVIVDFVKGKYQMFLCTTIIESGLDMPNVNTMIVDEADKMGLAQLYQLRGRVGRSNRIAYAYLTYRPERIITEAAGKRLNAIREFNEMGAGMKIALRDLEIRGAGNILGPEQHGYIQAVGFDLYCRLLEQQTIGLKGLSVKEDVNPQMDIDVDYYIPDTYIPDAGTKMRIYRRLLLAREKDEIEDIENELLDRFGPLPRPVENFLQIALLRIKAREKEIKGLRRKGRQMEIQVATDLPQDFMNRSGHLKIKKINDSTFSIQLGESTSINDLERVLNSI
ncbi:MAG: transcription-repair coupling factor, partial [Syntrophomonas sp.]